MESAEDLPVVLRVLGEAEARVERDGTDTQQLPADLRLYRQARVDLVARRRCAED
jgi:hypothetical protein